MTRMLIVSSDTPEEDVQAAFTIVREALKDDKLEKITWYSNFARSIVRFDERISAIENNIKTFVEAFNKFGIETRAQFEQIKRMEKSLMDLTKPSKEKKA